MPNYTASVSRTLNEKLGESPSVLDFGAVGDGFTDDTAALQAAITACSDGIVRTDGSRARSLRLVAGKRYKITDTLLVTSDLYFYADHINWAESPQSAVIAMTDPTKDFIRCSANTAHFKGIVFTHHAGYAGAVASVTSTSITLESSSDVYLATLTAESLVTGLQVYCYRIYTTGGKIYRMRTVASGGATVGATMPSHTSGTVTVDGIAWEYKGAGTTYQRGQYNNTGVWWFSSVAGNVLQDVTTYDQGSTSTPDNWDGLGSDIGERGYFVSNEFQAQTGANTAAAIHFTAGNDSQVERCWFNVVPACAIRVDSPAQGGIWSHNVIDNAYYGFYGEFQYAIIHHNRFYNCQRGVNVSRYYRVKDEGNYFQQCGICWNLIDSSYSAALPLTSNADIELSTITNWHTQTCGQVAVIEGAKGLRFGGGSTAARTQLSPAVALTESDSCVVRDIVFASAGEADLSSGGAYFVLDTNNYYHHFAGLRFLRVNTGEKVTHLFKWTVDHSADCSFSDIEYDESAYTASDKQTEKRLEVQRLRSGISNRTITAETITPGSGPQVINYTGNVTANTDITLSRTGARDGDFIVVNFSISIIGAYTLRVLDGSTGLVPLSITNPDGYPYRASYLFTFGRNELGTQVWFATALGHDPYSLLHHEPGGANAIDDEGYFSITRANGWMKQSNLRQLLVSESGPGLRFDRTDNGPLMVLVAPGGNLNIGTTGGVLTLKNTGSDIIIADASGTTMMRFYTGTGDVTLGLPGNTNISLVNTQAIQTLKNKTIKASENTITLDALKSILVKDDAGFVEIQLADGTPKWKADAAGDITACRNATLTGDLTMSALTASRPVKLTSGKKLEAAKIDLTTSNDISASMNTGDIVQWNGTACIGVAVGTSSGQVAAGDHNHTSVYALESHSHSYASATHSHTVTLTVTKDINGFVTDVAVASVSGPV